jgi:hypothetical protein
METNTNFSFKNDAAAETKQIIAQGASGSFDPFNSKHLTEIAVVIYLFLDGLATKEGVVQTEAKEMDSNADMMNDLNHQAEAIHFSMIPPDASNALINEIEQKNQQYAAERQDIDMAQVIVKQVNTVLMDRANANIDLLQQNASMTSGTLGNENTIFKVINEIGKSQ